jgi:lipopolysaccharide transport system permease protein
MFGFNKQDFKLAVNLFKMMVKDRYLGSSLGSYWAIANPLFMLSIYTFVFGFIFKVRLPGAETTLAYVIWLISGYGPWLATVEAIMSSTTSVVAASGIVKNMTFKTELLPIAAVFVGVIPLLVSFLFLLFLIFFDGKYLDWNILFLPLIIFIQCFFVIALGMWLSVINVFVRDLGVVLPNLLMIVMFLTPIFYPVESLPNLVQNISIANPFYVIAEAYRSVFLANSTPNLIGLSYVFFLALTIFYFGLSAYRRAKGHFDSVL